MSLTLEIVLEYIENGSYTYAYENNFKITLKVKC